MAYGPRGEEARDRALKLASSPTVIKSGTAEFGNSARDLAREITGLTEVLVIHLVDPDENELTEIVEGLKSVAVTAAQLPAVFFRQWVIALVGEEWDDHELKLLDLVGSGTEDRRVAGVLVLGLSSEARGLLLESDEVVMASDLVYSLIVSNRLREAMQRLDLGQPWTAGVASVIYRRRVLAAAIAAFHAMKWLDKTLLAPLEPIQPYGTLGLQWPSQTDLTTDRHVELLSRGPTGGSALSGLAVSDDVFEDTPVELVSDALRSYFEQLAAGMLTRVKLQIDRNYDAHLAELKSEIQIVVARHLRESQNCAAMQDFLENVDAGLAELLQQMMVRIALAEKSLPDLDAIQEELEQAIRSLPYPAAVAARGAGYGALGIAAYTVGVGALGLTSLVAPAGLAVGGLAAALLYGWYHRRKSNIQRLRRKYLRAMELRLRAEAELHVLQKMVDEIMELRRYTLDDADGPAGRLKRFSAQLMDLRRRFSERVDTRGYGELISTRYSVLVPDPQSWSTAQLADRFTLKDPEKLYTTLLRTLLPTDEIQSFDSDKVDAVAVDAVVEQIDNDLWADLHHLLGDSPTARARALTVLATPVSPVLRRRDFNVRDEDIRRFLVTGHEESIQLLQSAAQVGQALEEQHRGEAVRLDVDGTQHSDDPDTIAVVALRPAMLNVVPQAEPDA